MFILLRLAESRCLQLDVFPAGGATGGAWRWMAVNPSNPNKRSFHVSSQGKRATYTTEVKH